MKKAMTAMRVLRLALMTTPLDDSMHDSGS